MSSKLGSGSRQRNGIAEPESNDGDNDVQKQLSVKSLSIAGVNIGDVVWAKYSSYPWWPGEYPDACCARIAIVWAKIVRPGA